MLYEEVERRIGKKETKKFLKWMYGQTCGLTEKGEHDYYEHDFLRYCRKDNLYQPHLFEILCKMFDCVGATYHADLVKKRGWFLKNQWTVEQQEEYIKWLTNYLYKNKEAREEIVFTPNIKTKKWCEKAARVFVFEFGWKIKNGNNTKS